MWWHIIASKCIKQNWPERNEVDTSTVRVGYGNAYFSVADTATRRQSVGSDAAPWG